ncbi:MAG: YbjP/YqhG family protein [Acidobacteriota bacterium]|nr:YbjP/YqhG family protein [Acidobacteriota bacterium]
MSSKFKILSSKLRNYELKSLIVFSLFAFCFSLFTFACSVPNLEKTECTAARQTVKELYSHHFGGDMKFTKENLGGREKYLSRELIENLSKKDESAVDYFTATDDYPKAFRVGDCEVIEPEKRVNFGVLLFWKTDTRSEQREIRVEAVRENGKWSVNRVGN